MCAVSLTAADEGTLFDRKGSFIKRWQEYPSCNIYVTEQRVG